MRFIKQQIIRLRISVRILGIFFKLITGEDYRNLGKCGKKIILLDTPDHGNLGDHAIAMAEHKFLRDNFNCVISEFTHNEYCLFKKYIVKRIHKDDIIILTGGGYIGTLWKNEENVSIDILDTFKDNHIIIMPQTLFFSADEDGVKEEKKFVEALNDCSDITVMLRDNYSFEKMKEMRTKARLLLVPDIVTYLTYSRNSIREKKVLLCLRKDIEKSIDNEQLNSLLSDLKSNGVIIVSTDTVVTHLVSKTKREYEVNKKLKEFSESMLVITDRLHGMLLSAITSTPCIAFNNVSGKVFGAYEFIKYLNYINVANDGDEGLEKLRSLLEENENNQYENIPLQIYYSAMVEAVKEKVTNLT